MAQSPGRGSYMSRQEFSEKHSGVNEFPFLKCDKDGHTIVYMDLGDWKGKNVRMPICGNDGNKGRVEREVMCFSTCFGPSCFTWGISFNLTPSTKPTGEVIILLQMKKQRVRELE